MATGTAPAKTPSRQRTATEINDSPQPPALDGQPASTENVDKIRDILFGTQMRDYERRFLRLEERLLKECADLRSDTHKRLDATDAYIKHEIESLAERLNRERTERIENVEDFLGKLTELTKDFERKVRQIEDQNSKSQRDFRQQLLEQGKLLSDEIRTKFEEISSLCELRLQELRADKVDRSALASLLNETALRLTGDFRVPGTE